MRPRPYHKIISSFPSHISRTQKAGFLIGVIAWVFVVKVAGVPPLAVFVALGGASCAFFCSEYVMRRKCKSNADAAVAYAQAMVTRRIQEQQARVDAAQRKLDKETSLLAANAQSTESSLVQKQQMRVIAAQRELNEESLLLSHRVATA